MWTSKKYVTMLEAELSYYRALAERERARADRLHDQLLQDRGCVPATDTVINAQNDAAEKYKSFIAEQNAQMSELFAEEVTTHKDVFENASEADLVESLSSDIRSLLAK